ncbi:flagellin [Piscinibacter gummiphilus]|uniref:Flagellin n=1 Tax=Piscinibacter gummiphilus TaxID=946333 RepID=A0A1W6LA99_9BURK|nr:flagellin [Piscinibacter gummiphilus]ARN21231.1 Lateral flagellin [Piscinibacter gummiphilus]ATU65914.1 Lateral flagellin [Piscinibacter gummiphilus]GLS93793.1 lateral flagellin [Piscinibacter gummiphilus]
MLSLNTNAAALSAQSSVGSTQKSLSTSMTRLSTGYRVNSAMDDAAGLQIATRLNAQTRGQAVAQRNTQNGISMMQTAEGAFNEVTDMLLRMKDLATEASNGTASVKDQDAMQLEFDALGQEISNIMKNTSFGGAKLLDGGSLATTAGVSFQIGATSAEKMTLTVGTDMTTLINSITAATSNYTAATAHATGTGEINATNANGTIDKISTAIDNVGKVRAQLGAASNRLDHVYNNLSNMSTNTTQARGRIMDVDYATETANMTSKQMLMQAGTSMLKQSSSMSQLVMSLMQ